MEILLDYSKKLPWNLFFQENFSSFLIQDPVVFFCALVWSLRKPTESYYDSKKQKDSEKFLCNLFFPP